MPAGKTDLAELVAIVTGGGRGLGRAMALGLAAAGAQVVVTAARERDELDRVAAEAPRGAVLPILADVSNADDCARVVRTAIDRFGGLNVLVNNAGRGMKYVSERFMTEPAAFWDVSPETWQMVIDTNVNGPFLMSRAAAPHLMRGGWGRIVNVSMNRETMRRRGFSPYGPSKAALEAETAIWAQDLHGTGVTVNALLPGGATRTGMIPASVPEAVRATLLAPEIVVPPLLWLASRSSDGITGKRVVATRWNADAPLESLEDAG
ncbi:MAG TPA: SDR family oxidoreductase [Candidatus Dormibacteraeota bacterium]|nr:SDR family oxidoreductase [Candidatus Dormibacteraeota bacterium]